MMRSCKRVASGSIKPSRNEYKLGLKLVAYWKHNVLESKKILRVSHDLKIPGDVHVEAFSFTPSHPVVVGLLTLRIKGCVVIPRIVILKRIVTTYSSA